MDFKNKRVFVSGGAGVIGTYLVNKLIDLKAVVWVGDLKPCPQEWMGKIRYRQGDLNYISKNEIEQFKPEYFFHLAATFERSTETYSFWEENFHNNIKLSHYLMTLLKDVKSLRKVIFASSYLIYDPELYLFNTVQEKPKILAEDSAIRPRNLTGMAKLAFEAELDFLKQFSSTKFKAVSARIYRSYGKNSRDVISRWIRSLLKNKTIDIYGEAGIFDYIYAGDVAEGLIYLAKNPTSNGVVNLGTGKSRKVSEVLDILRIYFPRMKCRKISVSTGKLEASEANMNKYFKNFHWTPKTTLEVSIPEIINYERSKLNKRNIEQPKNILITSISSKVPLINAVSDASRKIGTEIKIYGGDTDNNALGKYFVDYFWEMPRLKDLSIMNLIEYCRKQNIGVIIPTRDGELAYFSKHKQKLVKHGVNVMVSNLDSVNLSLDKLTFYKKLSKKNIPVVQTDVSIDKIDSKLYVVKERYGAGSRKIGIKLNKRQAITHSSLLQFPIFQPYIDGIESSIDVYVTQSGLVKGLVSRVRDIISEGESQVTTTFQDKKLSVLVVKLVKVMGLKGHAVIQVIKDKKGRYHFVECNARFGGASTLSIAVGLDSFYWFILETMGVNIDPYIFERTKREMKQVRYKEDKVIFE